MKIIFNDRAIKLGLMQRRKTFSNLKILGTPIVQLNKMVCLQIEH